MHAGTWNCKGYRVLAWPGIRIQNRLSQRARSAAARRCNYVGVRRRDAQSRDEEKDEAERQNCRAVKFHREGVAHSYVILETCNQNQKLHPECSVEGAILDGFADVFGSDGVGFGEV